MTEGRAEATRSGPLPRGLAWLGGPLSALYARIIAARNERFDRRIGVVELDRPVISVGNLSVGGTGKTPMVRRVVSALRDAGRSPCVAMRGYAPRGGTSGIASDEAEEYRRALPDTPLVAQPDRIGGLIELFGGDQGDAIDTVVLDDGFQHRRIWRELDIVLIDATRSPFADRPLPAGWLREPVESLRRAGAVVITHAERVGKHERAALGANIERVCGRPATAVCRHTWESLTVNDGAGARTESVSWLSDRRVGAACAIGNPGAFLAQVRESARGVVGEVVLPDHDPFDQASLARVADLARTGGAEAIVVTSKDWSKLSRVPALVELAPIVVPELGIAFDRGEQDLWRMVVAAAETAKPRAGDDNSFDVPGESGP